MDSFTHILLVMGWGAIRLHRKTREDSCSQSVGHGMRCDKTGTAWQKGHSHPVVGHVDHQSNKWGIITHFLLVWDKIKWEHLAQKQVSITHHLLVSGMRWDETTLQNKKAVLLTRCWSWDERVHDRKWVVVTLTPCWSLDVMSDETACY